MLTNSYEEEHSSPQCVFITFLLPSRASFVFFSFFALSLSFATSVGSLLVPLPLTFSLAAFLRLSRAFSLLRCPLSPPQALYLLFFYVFKSSSLSPSLHFAYPTRRPTRRPTLDLFPRHFLFLCRLLSIRCCIRFNLTVNILQNLQCNSSPLLLFCLKMQVLSVFPF